MEKKCLALSGRLGFAQLASVSFLHAQERGEGSETNMKLTTINLTEYMIKRLDEAVGRGYVCNRSVAIREAIRDYLKELCLW